MSPVVEVPSRPGVCVEEGFVSGGRRYEYRQDGVALVLYLECTDCGFTPAMFFSRQGYGWNPLCDWCRRKRSKAHDLHRD